MEIGDTSTQGQATQGHMTQRAQRVEGELSVAHTVFEKATMIINGLNINSKFTKSYERVLKFCEGHLKN